MRDPRCDRLAELVVGYGLRLQPGETVVVQGGDEGKPLLLALYRAALAAGAHPWLRVLYEETDDMLLAAGNDEQLEWLSPGDRLEREHPDAVVSLFSEGDTRRKTLVRPERQR